MNNVVFISLLNPAIASVLALAFLLFWIFQRQQTHLAVLAFAYWAAAAGFVLQHLILPIGFEATKLLSCVFFMLAVLSISATVISWHRRPVPWRALALLGSSGLLTFTWFLLIEPSLTWRIYAMNFAMGGTSLIVAAELRRARVIGPTTNVLLVLATLSGLNFIFRPLITVNADMNYLNLNESLYWTTALLSHGILLLLIALTLLATAALDIMKQYRMEAHIDPLSGILNRRGFEEAVLKAMGGRSSSSIPAAIIVADLDHFKEVNDRFGHAAGDKVIITFSNLIATAADLGGFAGRTGGEEFAVFLPIAEAAAARVFAEGIRTALASSVVPGIPRSTKLTASFGVAVRVADEALPAMFRRADEALYKAKHNGRNSVCVSYPAAPVPTDAKSAAVT